MSPYIRTVTTASGATAVQVIHSEKRGSKKLTHIGSAHTPQDLALLRVKAQRMVDGDQMSLDLGVDTSPAGTGTHQAPVPVSSEKAGHLIDAITTAYQWLNFTQATGRDRTFQNLVMAQIIQPGSKLDSTVGTYVIGNP